MLTPQQLLEIIDTLYPQIDELNAWITTDIIKRVMARLGRGEFFLTATDDWQLQVYQAAGGHLETVQKELYEWTKKTDEEIKRIFEDAGIKALSLDSAFYIEHGLEGFNIRQSESMIRLLQDTYERTLGTVHNFTRTTASASQQRLINLLDTAHFKVTTGATSYTQAVQDALDDIVNTQTQVKYPSGHVDTIETAVLRAVRTGVAQASGNMAIQGMIERDWDVVLVSAHLGARYGDGGQNPGNHFWWQGKFYSRTGRTPDLPLFNESTGYGTGEGLCGWNCRHSFGPGDLEHNPYNDYDEKENKEAYDLSQKQRKQERTIRHTKTKLIGLREAMEAAEDPTVKADLEEKYSKTSQQLLRQNTQYNTFCQENGLKRLSDRIQVAKWSREDARKSIDTVKRLEKFEKDAIIKEETEKIHLQIQTGRIPLTLNKGNQNKHIVNSHSYKPEEKKSFLYGDCDFAQQLVNQYAGTGELKFTKECKWTNKEFIEASVNIGETYNADKKSVPTNRFAIHYGKKGTHVVPVLRKEQQNGSSSL